MKTTIFSILALAFALQVHATTVSFSSDQADAKNGDLTDVPQALLSILTDHGFKLKLLGGEKYGITVKAIHCDFRHRAAYDGPIGGIATEVCRYNSKNQIDSVKGHKLSDSHEFAQLVERVQNSQAGGGLFTDCAMGYCGTFVKTLTCTVDVKIQDFFAGRFTCALTDAE